MPNHVTTICDASGPSADVAAFVARHFTPGENGSQIFDFNTIVPMPESVKATESSSDATMGMAAMIGEEVWVQPCAYGSVPKEALDGAPIGHAKKAREWLEKNRPQALVKARACFAALAETGYSDWYRWSIANWGTKWGAYSLKLKSRTDSGVVFKFETAWNFPTPAFEKLREMHPTLRFHCISFDEGWNFAHEGHFSGARSGGKNDFHDVDPTDAMYERVYGRKPERDEDEPVAEEAVSP